MGVLRTPKENYHNNKGGVDKSAPFIVIKMVHYTKNVLNFELWFYTFRFKFSAYRFILYAIRYPLYANLVF